MVRLPEQLVNKLLLLNQRELYKAELILLAKVISDKLPLPSIGVDSVVINNLKYRSYINEVLYAINDYSYLSEESRNYVYDLINRFTHWRYKVAYGSDVPYFSGDDSTVIDELTGICSSIDRHELCRVVEILSDANYTYRLYYDIAYSVHKRMKDSGGS